MCVIAYIYIYRSHLIQCHVHFSKIELAVYQLGTPPLNNHYGTLQPTNSGQVKLWRMDSQT